MRRGGGWLRIPFLAVLFCEVSLQGVWCSLDGGSAVVFGLWLR